MAGARACTFMDSFYMQVLITQCIILRSKHERGYYFIKTIIIMTIINDSLNISNILMPSKNIHNKPYNIYIYIYMYIYCSFDIFT